MLGISYRLVEYSTLSHATIDDLRARLGTAPKASDDPAYRAKMLHKLPEAKTVDRVAFILKHCTGKRVLEFGASGKLHEELRKVSDYIGVDRAEGDRVLAYDLDDTTYVDLSYVAAAAPAPEVIVCGEVLEHLGNPLHFLTRLRKQYAGTPTIITVPNAFGAAGAGWLAKGYENVNRDHVAWYSPKTISVLLERAGYSIGQLFYYNGEGPTAEGLIVVTE